MNCEYVKDNLDDYIDGRLDGAATEAIEEHVGACSDCRRRIADASSVRDLVADYGRGDIAMPGPDFFEQALLRAVHRGSRKQRARWWMTGFGSAAAAALAVWMLSLALLPDRIDAPALDAAVPSIAMTLEEPRTVNLVFTSNEALDDARLTVLLPEGLTVAGFEGQREITWVTSLVPGRNILPLRLVATSPRGGELLATLRHSDDDKTFRLRVTIDQGASAHPAQNKEYTA